MNYKQLIATIKKIPDEELFISHFYSIWDTFDITLDWEIYYLTIPEDYQKKSAEHMFKVIMNRTNNDRSKPKNIQLSWEQAIEMLYHHYMYWYDNKSNCILIDIYNNILAIQYNWLDTVTTIKTDAKFPVWMDDFIVINNKKKLSWKYKKDDYDNLIPLLKKICAE